MPARLPDGVPRSPPRLPRASGIRPLRLRPPLRGVSGGGLRGPAAAPLIAPPVVMIVEAARRGPCFAERRGEVIMQHQ
ncbi:MAG: hypothetical protein E6J71_26275 [Deltaproteobacteria bacterium]|nr:MAG: hypothetical protein E6J71_26275 [Deltaproteobacteria bacterium]